MQTIRVLIADDHPVVRKGLRILFQQSEGFELVGEADDGKCAVQLAHELKPDVILMDLMMPNMDGISAIQMIRSDNPAAKILILSSFSSDDQVFPAIRAGASGYMLKDSLPQELLQAIRDVHSGKPSLHPLVAGKLMQEFNQQQGPDNPKDLLTEREVEVLKLVAQGLSNQEIAGELVIGERTVGTHISSILTKLHLENRTQAALFALREGLVSLYQKTSKPAK